MTQSAILPLAQSSEDAKLRLPQNDLADKSQRQQHLKKMQQDYAFSLTYHGQIATLDKMPAQEKPPLSYYLKLSANMTGTLTSLPGLAKRYVKFSLLKQPFKKYDDYLFFKRAPFANKKMRDNFWDDQ